MAYQSQTYNAKLATHCITSGKYKDSLFFLSSAIHPFSHPTSSAQPLLLPSHILPSLLQIIACLDSDHDLFLLQTADGVYDLLLPFVIMTGTTGSKKNKSRGATKGKKIPVYISGLQGKHTMETGIAYFYRGHDLYGPMRNPLMPVSFPTKSEVLVVGLTYDCAPHYNPANPTLRDERQVCALGRSKFHEWENRSKETAPEDKSTPFEGQVAIVNNLMANSTGTIMPAQGKSGNQTAETAYSISRNPSVQVHAPETTNTHDSDRYYNDHALYLAASAPGSRPLTRFSTPFGSRSISPSVGHAASGGGLRAVASTTQISHMYGDYEQYMSSLSHHLNGEHMSYEQYMSSLETQNGEHLSPSPTFRYY
jgi:hypothetical protein